MCASVGAIAFDGGDDSTSIPFVVAAIGFDATFGVADAAFSQPDADAATHDSPADAAQPPYDGSFSVSEAGFGGLG
jgi:hypothetical protein